jgi:hypothetical protein
MRKPQTTYDLWARQCGKGWDTLVQPLEDEVSRFGARYGRSNKNLRACFFHSLPRSISEAKRQAFARTVRQVAEISMRICETCGATPVNYSVISSYMSPGAAPVLR